MDNRITTLAENLVNYSCQVKPGDKVYVHYTGDSTRPLAKEIVKKVYEAGGVPFVHFTDPQLQRAQLMHCTKEQMELMAEVDNVKEAPVYLKVVVEKLTRAFYYSYDGENWELVDVLENCIYLCDEGVPDDPKRHTGTLVGIYANNGGCGSRKAADFDYFKYED